MSLEQGEEEFKLVLHLEHDAREVVAGELCQLKLLLDFRDLRAEATESELGLCESSKLLDQCQVVLKSTERGVIPTFEKEEKLRH